MPAYSTIPTGIRMRIQPRNVTPRSRWRILPPVDFDLVDRIADAAPDRPLRTVPIEPDPDRLADEVALGYEAHTLVAAVLAVVAVVTHEEVVSLGHDVDAFAALPARP